MLHRYLQVGIGCALLVVVGCSEAMPTTPAERGRRVYLSACTTCHNSDPSLTGRTGPPVAGSSRELIEARVLRAQYPAGYTPQRDSKAMLALPHLAPYIDDLTSFLAVAAEPARALAPTTAAFRATAN